ncbi:hypothetical protein SKAU_G00087100 [Synaphobranchus kaupii]|uniref:Uncharacterized protein n=1 Tax=Synaphobranchus kaupii TaxID=118154 RepID=A0A9Q1FW47_SYNKA|nr:hypothetical protein SKAU_G00087100 [Synaphobranchus kaupii]
MWGWAHWMVQSGTLDSRPLPSKRSPPPSLRDMSGSVYGLKTKKYLAALSITELKRQRRSSDRTAADTFPHPDQKPSHSALCAH